MNRISSSSRNLVPAHVDSNAIPAASVNDSPNIQQGARTAGIYSMTHIFNYKGISINPKVHLPPLLNETKPLSLFYSADEKLQKTIKKLVFIANSTKEDSWNSREDLYKKFLGKAHAYQKQLLDSIYVLYLTELDEELKTDKSTYRAELAIEDQSELVSTYSENIFFAAQALVSGHRIRGIESYTQQLLPSAEVLVDAMDSLREYCKIKSMCSNPKYIQSKLAERVDLETLLQNDKDAINQKLQAFDSAWFDFEKIICTSYQISQKVTRNAELDMLLILMSETIIRALVKGHINRDLIDEFDPSLMITLPRLLMVSGLVHYPNLVRFKPKKVKNSPIVPLKDGIQIPNPQSAESPQELTSASPSSNPYPENERIIKNPAKAEYEPAFRWFRYKSRKIIEIEKGLSALKSINLSSTMSSKCRQSTIDVLEKMLCDSAYFDTFSATNVQNFSIDGDGDDVPLAFSKTHNANEHTTYLKNVYRDICCVADELVVHNAKELTLVLQNALDLHLSTTLKLK